MTEAESARYRKLWASVVLTALSEHRSRIQAAGRGRTSLYIGSNRAALGTLEAEVTAARRYVHSADFRTVCELAGVLPRAPEALTFLEQAEERISMKSVMESRT